MKTILRNQAHPELNHQKTSSLQNKELAHPPKSLGFRFCTYLVLWSFFFQTIWPSVAFAEALIREKTPIHGGIRRHSLSLGVHIHDKHVDTRVVDDDLGAQRAKSTRQPKGRRIQVEFDQGLPNLQAELQKSLDVQSFYPGLQATEKGLTWTSFGRSFLMTYEGNLVVSRDIELGEDEARQEHDKKPFLDLLNPHGDIVLGPDLQVDHVQARAKDVYMAGSSVIPHLEIWAHGGSILTNPEARTAEGGRFRIPLEATLTTKLLTIHQGKTELDGTVSLVKDGVLDAKGNEVSKTGTLTVETGVTVRNVPNFQNEGPIQGRSLTLEDTVFTNGERMTLDHLSTSGGKFYNNSHVALQSWHQGGEVFSNALGSTFQVQGQSIFEESSDIRNQGALSLLGNNQGSIEKFTSSGNLTMGSVSGLTVSTFSNTGNFEVTGPMNWSGRVFKTTHSTILRGKTHLDVSLLETQGIFSALEDFIFRGHWHQGRGVTTLSKDASFDAQKIWNQGTMLFLGESRGTIGTLTNEGSLIMGIVSGLRVRDFSSPGTFEVTGPMNWSGEKFKAAKATFRGKTSITSAVIETEDDLTAESDLSLLGNWTHKKGKARIAGLLLKGKSFKTEQGGSVTVTGPADVQTNTVDNEGAITFEGAVKGRIDDFINRGNVTIQGDAHLTGKSILNSNTFKALGIFDWVGETLTNTTTGKMSLFDNRVMATRQVINQGLLLWTHNTFRTWHFLNMGWAEMTRNLDAVMPDIWRAPQDTSTTFKKSTVENRGTLKIAPKDYTPRMTIEHCGDFAHWSNKGQMQLPATHLQAQSFKNEGDLVVDGALTGTVEAFENTSKAVLQGPVHLTGKSFTSTGTMVLANKSTLKVDSLTTGGTFTAQSDLTLEDGVDWTNLEGSKTDIARLLFKGKNVENDGNLLIRELIGSPSTKWIAFLRNGHTNSPKGEKTRPVFKILKGSASLPKVVNHGVVALVEGRYLLRDVTNPGILEVDTLLPEGTDPFVLNGTVHAKSFCTSAFRGTKIINTGKTTVDSASFSTQLFENGYGAILTLFGYGTAHIDTLRNSGIISLNQRADMVVDTLQNSLGTIESSQNSLRVLLLDPGQTAKSDVWHPMLKLRKDHGGLLDMGKFKSKDDLIIEIADSLNVACYLHLYADKWQCGGILRLYGDTFWARWHDTYTGAVNIKVKHFQNPNAHLIFRSLKVEADDFYNGRSNEEMGYIETMPDTNNPDADTSLEIISKEDLDNRHGKMFGHGETYLRSIEGDVLSGESVNQTKHILNCWAQGCHLSHPYYETNESFIGSNKDITIDGRNIFLKLAQVKSIGGHLYLVAEKIVRSLASDVYAKDGITINGVRFDNEIFATDYSTHGYDIPHGSQRHLSYTYYGTPQRSRPSSVRSLGDIRMNTKITRSYGSHILTSKSLIDKKGKRWKGKTTSESRQKDMCPFISYESQALPNKWDEHGQGGATYYGTPGCVLSVVEAGEDVKAEAPYVENSGWMSSSTMELTAVDALLQYMGAPAQQAIQTLMDLGILSVRHFVEPEVTQDGFMTQQPNGTVREKGTRAQIKKSTPLNELPLIGKHPRGVPDHTQMYVQIHVEVEKLQQMMAFTLGRLYDQGLVGEDVYDEYVREGQRQHLAGALVDIRQNQSTKPFIAYLLEKVRNAETNEEVLLAVMNLFVPEALRVQLRSGEARTAYRNSVKTERDATFVGGKLRSDHEKVVVDAGRDLNVVPKTETVGSSDNYNQRAERAEFEAPEDEIIGRAGRDANLQALRAVAKTKISVKAKRHLIDETVGVQSQRSSNMCKKQEREWSLTNIGSEWILLGSEEEDAEPTRLELIAETGVAALRAPYMKADQGVVYGQHGVHILDAQDQYTYESSSKSGGGVLGQKETHIKKKMSSTSKGARIEVKKFSIVDGSGKTGITVVGANLLKVKELDLDCEHGPISLRAGVNAYMEFESTQGSNAAWQSYEHTATSSTTHTPVQIDPECLFKIKSVVPVLVETVKGQTLAWLEPMRQNLEKNGGTLNIHELEDIYKYEQVEHQGPTAAAAIVLAIAITAATAGTMSQAGLAVAQLAGLGTTATTAAGVTVFTASTAGAFVQVMTAAALTSLTVSATNCVLNNTNDLGKALNDFVKTDTWKAALTAAAAAGLLKGANQAFGTPVSGADATARATEDAAKATAVSAPPTLPRTIPQVAQPTFAQSIQASILHQAQFHAMNAAANMAADMAIHGQSPEKVFKGGATNAVINALAATAANTVAWGMSVDLLNKFGQFMCHLGIGAGIGAATNGERGALDGALFAGVAETIANMTREDPSVTNARAREKAKDQGVAPTRQNLSTFVQDELRKTVDIGVLGTSFFALLLEKDVALAHRISRNALENNFAKEELEKCLGFSAIDAYTNATLDQLQEDEDFVRDASDAAVDEANKSLEERAEKTPIGKAHKAVKDGVKAGAKAVGLDRLADAVSDHIDLDGLRDAASSHADRVGQGASGYAASKIEQVEALRGPLSDEQRSFLQQEFEDHHEEDAFARDMMNVAADGMALLFSLPGKAAEAVLNQTNLTSDATAHALGNLTNDAVALVGGAMAVKQAFKAGAAELGKQILGKPTPRFPGLAAANANKAPVFMAPSANRNLADAITQSMQRTAAGGGRSSIAPPMMSRGTVPTPPRTGTSGLGHASSGLPGASAPTPAPSMPKSALKQPRSSAPKKEVRFGDQADAANKGPYDSRAMDALLKEKHGADAVSSSTLPSTSMPNVKLAGKSLTTENGTRITFDQRGYPIFDDHVRYQTILSEQTCKMTEQTHKTAATKNLWQSIQNGEASSAGFTEKQILAIQKGNGQIPGYTWHHHQETGRMQLLPRDIHDKVKHAGGMNNWGGDKR